MVSTREVVRRGTWLYDGIAPSPVAVVRLDYDFWYEIGKADEQLEPDEKPHLNDAGFQYYVCFASPPEQHHGWVDSHGFDTVEAACEWAEKQIQSAIQWHVTI